MSEVLIILAKSIISDFETPVNETISEFETPVSRLISLFETPDDPFISESATPAAAIISEIETHLKILENIKNSIKDIKQSNVHPNSSSFEPEPEANQAADWNLSKILNNVKPEFRKEILSNPQKERAFMAILIQSALNGRVNRPMNLALSQTLQGNSASNAAAQRLAEMGKSKLIELLELALDQPAGLDYQRDPAMRRQVTDLQLLLVGEDARSRALLLQRLIDLLQ